MTSNSAVSSVKSVSENDDETTQVGPAPFTIGDNPLRSASLFVLDAAAREEIYASLRHFERSFDRMARFCSKKGHPTSSLEALKYEADRAICKILGTLAAGRKAGF